MNWLQKLIGNLFGIKSRKPISFDRPAKSVAFEAKGQKVVDEVKVNTPWEAAAESIRKNQMFDRDSVEPSFPVDGVMRVVGAINELPPGTTALQYLALYEDPQECDTMFIDSHFWVWLSGKWVDLGKGAPSVHVDNDPIARAANKRLDRYRAMQSRNLYQGGTIKNDPNNGYDPLLNSLIVEPPPVDTAPHRNSHSRQDSHRYEDSSPTHHHTPSHSHSHDHNRHDDGGNHDSGGTDSSGSCD